MKMCNPTVSNTVSLPMYKVRRTFILSKFEIDKLKNFVMKMNPTGKGKGSLSSFMVVCGYVWSCLAKSAAEEVDDDEPEYLRSMVNLRGRLELDPPLPDNYFGNCLILFLAESTHGRLKGNEGFIAAVEAIQEGINKTVNNERGVLDGFEDKSEMSGKTRVVPVIASPKFDVYGVDFGWGRPKKFECLFIDFIGAFSFCMLREGGIELGLSMPKIKMDAFAAIFQKNLPINSNL